MFAPLWYKDKSQYLEDKEAVGIDYYIIVITPDIVMKCVSIILNQYNAQYRRHVYTAHLTCICVRKGNLDRDDLPSF